MSNLHKSIGLVTLNRYFILGATFILLLLFAAPGISATGSMQLNRVIAVVNGELITMYDLQQHAMPEIIRRGLTGGDQNSAEERQRVFNDALDTLILDILYKQEAERYMITVDAAEVDNEMRKLIQANNMTPEEFERQIGLQGMSMDDLRRRLHDSIMRQRLISAMVSRKAEVTPQEIEAHYHANIDQYSKASSVEFSVIMLEPSSNAQSIYEQIKSGKMSFADAARKYSISPTASIGGSMGKIPWRDLNPTWSDAMAGLGVGDTTPPIATGESTVLLHVDAIHAGDAKTLEDVAPEIEEQLRSGRLRDRFQEYSNQLRSKAVVEMKI